MKKQGQYKQKKVGCRQNAFLTYVGVKFLLFIFYCLFCFFSALSLRLSRTRIFCTRIPPFFVYILTKKSNLFFFHTKKIKKGAKIDTFYIVLVFKRAN